MASTLLIVQFILAVFIAIAVLLQKSSGMGLGGYSGSNESMFGAKGPGGFLVKFTYTMGLLFIINTVSLGYYYNQQTLTSVVDDINQSVPAAPVVEKNVTKAPVVVEKNITIEKIDTDNDGIEDKNDKCSNTIAGAKVDDKGCQIFEEPVDLKITFKSNSSALEKGSKTKFKAYIDYLKQHKDTKIKIEAFTDDVGSEKSNLKLSQARADSTKNALVEMGIDEKRVISIGHGESNPIVANDTKENRKLNRRVTAKIIK